MEGHRLPDPGHRCLTIPPKYPLASGSGFVKGKSARAVARRKGQERHFPGEPLWAGG